MIARSLVAYALCSALMTIASVSQAVDRTPPCAAPLQGGAGETTACIWWMNNESGDDCHTGLPTCWEIRQSSSPFDGFNWVYAPVIASGPCIGETDQGFSVSGLSCNTTYYWALGNSYGTLGKTLQRRVDLNFNLIKITDDSDSVGKGELTFNFQVNSVRRKDFDFYRATGTNETFNPNRTAIVYNGGENLNTKIMVQDDDCEFSTCIIDPAMFNRGDNSDNEWTTASTSINFSDVQSNYSQKTLRLASFEWWIGMDASALATIYYY